MVASGPSIKTQDLKKLRGEISISVANSFVHPDFHIFQPRYHCVPDILGGHGQYVEDRKAHFVAWLQSMDRNLGSAELFLSVADKPWVEKIFSRKINYLLLDSDWERTMNESIDLTRLVPNVQSVSVLAIEIALFMGVKEIFLLGCDHDWLLHVGTSTHFYDSKDHIVLAGKTYSEWQYSSFGRELTNSYNLWKQYEKLQTVAKLQGCTIYNASGGVLDVFPRVRYEEVLGSAPQQLQKVPQ